MYKKQENLYMNRHEKCIKHIARNEGVSLADAERKYMKMRSGRRVAILKEIERHAKGN